MKFLSRVAENAIFTAETMDIHLVSFGHAFIIVPDAAAMAGLALVGHVRSFLDDVPIHKTAADTVGSTDMALTASRVAAGAAKTEAIAFACVVITSTTLINCGLVSPKIGMKTVLGRGDLFLVAIFAGPGHARIVDNSFVSVVVAGERSVAGSAVTCLARKAAVIGVAFAQV